VQTAVLQMSLLFCHHGLSRKYVVAVLTALLVFLFVRLLQGRLNSFREQELGGMMEFVVFQETVGRKMSP